MKKFYIYKLKNNNFSFDTNLVKIGNILRFAYAKKPDNSITNNNFLGLIIKINKSIFKKTFTIVRKVDSHCFQQIIFFDSQNLLILGKKDSIRHNKAKNYLKKNLNII